MQMQKQKSLATIALLLLVFCIQVGYSQEPTSQDIELSELEGSWYINQSNFPMWTKGDKLRPPLIIPLTQKLMRPT